MSLAVFSVNQVSADSWVGEVEVGGLIAKREVVRSSNFHAIMAEIARAYWTMMPAPIVPRAMAVEQTMAGVVQSAPETVINASAGRVMVLDQHDQPIDPRRALQLEAEALGIDVDGRWREARLHDEIVARKMAQNAARSLTGGDSAE